MSFVYANAKNFYEQPATGGLGTDITVDAIQSQSLDADLTLSGQDTGNVRIADALEVATINGLATDGDITIAAGGLGSLMVNRNLICTGNIMADENGVGKIWCQSIDARSYDDQDSGNLGLYTEPEVGSILLWTDVLQTCDHTNLAGGGVDSAVTGQSMQVTVRASGGLADVSMIFVNGLLVSFD